jgi:hypothetical protein
VTSPWVRRAGWLSGIALTIILILTATARRNLALQSQPTEPPSTQQVGQQAEIPLMYQVTEGPQGMPAAKRCEGCFELPAPARNVADPAALSSLLPITGPVSGWEILEAQGFEDEWPWPGLCQILYFNEVEDPEGNHDRVKTIVWYQYHDTTSTAEEVARRMSIDPARLASDPEAICPADWGLVDGNREPKLAYWTFQAYQLNNSGCQVARVPIL